MKKSSFFATMLSLLFIGAAPVAADNCTPCWTPDCCDWSLCDGKFKVSGDWLYWDVAQDGIVRAELVDTGVVPNVISPIYPSHKYTSGYRVELGYELPSCCWEVGVSYLNLPSHSNTSAATTATTQNIILVDDVLPAALSARGISSLSAKWDFNINQIDVDFARSIAFGECFTLRPHAGFRALWGDQKTFVNAVSTATIELPAVSFVDAYKTKWTAYGIEAGFDARWKFGCGLAIVGKASGSLLYSKFSNSESFSVLSQVGTTFVDSVSSNPYWMGLPTLEYFLGLEYADSFCDFGFNIHAGWEQHYIFGLNRFFLLDSAHGNTSLQGLTLGLGVTF